MNWRPRTWMMLSLLLFAAAWLCWRLGEERRATHSPGQPVKTNSAANDSRWAGWFKFPWKRAARATPADPAKDYRFQNGPVDPRFPYRLTNTRKTGDEMFRSETAILLRHAFIETADGPPPQIPDHLRAPGDPGSYVVQIKGHLDAAFARQVRALGANIISYVPNNAYLVTATVDVAQRLAMLPGTQSVLPFEPYYKFSSDLIADAVQNTPQPADRELNVVAFPGARERVLAQLAALGAEKLAEQTSPFGPVISVRAGGDSYVALARMPEVHLVEARHRRAILNDLSRVHVGVATNTLKTTANFLTLSGNNVRVAVNDTGVDSTHADLSGRLVFDAANVGTGVDTVGHGTHVAGIIGSSGSSSPAIPAAGLYGSVVGADFRGIASKVSIYPQDFQGPFTDQQLITNASRTNIYISHNSWGLVGIYDYDITAAIYDAGVRDAQPQMPGDQPLNIVFSAGNDGNGDTYGTGGLQNTITSPASGKNVITVGAIEQPRFFLMTNGFFDAETDSSDQVADFSSRGNVAPGIEGTFGRFKPDLVAPGVAVLSLRSSAFTYTAANLRYSNYDATISPSSTYRFETGTSMAAPVVSGMLALMQEYFATTFNRTNSPALNKALLINGSRSVSLSYDRQVQNQVNYQGWGIPQLTNSLPSNTIAKSPVIYIDQDPTNAVATGDVRIYQVTVNNNSGNAFLTTNFPLRVTLAWTDPPGNPAVGPKLVNNLDLVVSNAVAVTNIYLYEGNNIPGGTDFNVLSTPGSPPVSDIINNVENVFIGAPLPTNVFYIYVIGRRVNVNAVTANTNGIVQDFALVVGTDSPNYVTVTQLPGAQTNNTMIWVTNGLPLLDQRVGANFPTSNVPSTSFTFSGSTNQWRFYVFTNTTLPVSTNIATNVFAGVTNMVTNVFVPPLTNGSNVAITIFNPPNLSRPRTYGQADVDLYVTRGDPQLTNLSATVISNCLAGNVPNYFASTNRGGNEVVTFTPSTAGDVFYIGVKAEDQQAASFGLAVISTDKPFNQTNNGAVSIEFFPVPMAIPDGTPDSPQGITLFGIGLTNSPIMTMSITNVIDHENLGDLVGTLYAPDGTAIVLNNHTITTNNLLGGLVSNTLIYNPPLTLTNKVAGGYLTNVGNPPDGPGDLTDFVGKSTLGLWRLTFVDSALEHTGIVQSVSVWANQRTNPPNTNQFILSSNQSFVDFFDVPIGATNLDVVVNLSSSSAIVFDFFAAFGYVPGIQTNDFSILNTNASFVFSINLSSSPPLRPGRWYFRYISLGGTPVNVSVNYRVGVDLTTTSYSDKTLVPSMGLLDNYSTNSSIFLTSTNDVRVVTGVEVGVQIVHTNAADLRVWLVSPSGTRVLLIENRGGTNANLFANFTEDTNKITVLVTNTAPVGYWALSNLLAPKYVIPPFTNLLSPPLFVNSNAYHSSPGANDNATALSLTGNRIAMAGFGAAFGAAYNDGEVINYATPVTNNPISLLWYTNWPGRLGGTRSGNMFFNSAAISIDGSYFGGTTRDYFPTPQAPSGGATPDIYDLDTGTTNGTLIINYQFYTVPDQMWVMYQGQTNVDTGMTNGSGTITFNFTGSNSFVRIIMNPTNGNAGTAWNYSVSVSAVNSPTYTWTNFAGSKTGVAGVPGDLQGANAFFNQPQGVAVDSGGNVYVADSGNHLIRKIDPSGNVTTLAGTVSASGTNDGALLAAKFTSPGAVAVDGAGNVYVADTGNNMIRKISQSLGTVTTIAGTNQSGYVDNANPLAAQFNSPAGIAVDGFGNLYISDTGNSVIRLMDTTGAVSTYAGTTPGYNNGAPLTAAQFTSPRGIAVDTSVNVNTNATNGLFIPATNVYVADSGTHTIRAILGGTNVVRIAGQPNSPGSTDGNNTSNKLNTPYGLDYDGAGSLFVTDAAHTIRKVSLGGLVSTIGGTASFFGEVDGVSVSARFNSPRGIAVAPGGFLFVGEFGNNCVRTAGFTVGSVQDKGVVVYYPTTGPITNTAPPPPARNGALWLGRLLTNNVFGYGGADRFQGTIINNENGTNWVYVTGSAEIQAGLEGFFIAKGKTNGVGLWMTNDNFTVASGASRGMALAIVNNTNIVCAGYTNGALNADRPYLTLFSTNGSKLNSKISGAPINVGRYYGVTAYNGFIYAIGSTATNSANTNCHCLIEQWDLNGNWLARQTYSIGAVNDSLYGVVGVGLSGRLYAVGTRTNVGGTSSDGILLEINPGTLACISTNIVSVASDLFNSASAVTTDNTDLYVAGTTDTGSGRQMMLFRYHIKDWYLPEEPLSQFVGEPSALTNSLGVITNGEWRLEITDSRDSNALAGASLLAWDLNLSYAPAGTPVVKLVPGATYSHVALGGQAQYFMVQTPANATRATNTITANGAVQLLYNLTRTPVAYAPGNMALNNGTNGQFVLTATGNSNRFVPGQRYYLAIIPREGATNISIRVDFDVTAPPPPALVSGVYASGAIASGAAMDYYQFTVPNGSAGTLFELVPANGNLDLYLRRADTNTPAAAQLTTGQYDYRSANSGSRNERILVVPGTGAVPLTPGVWYLGVANADAKSVSYSVRATSYGGAPYSVVPLASATPLPGTTTPGNAPNTMFKLTVPNNTPSALFEVTSLTGNGDLILRRTSYPTLATNDFKSSQPGTLAETVVLRTNTTWTSIAGDWYVGVVNYDSADLAYTVAAHLPTNGLLVSALPLALPSGRPPPQYFTNKHFGGSIGGVPGEKYQVQYKSNLASTNWITLGTYVTPSNGSFTFVHTNALTNLHLYYRIQQVP